MTFPFSFEIPELIGDISRGDDGAIGKGEFWRRAE
jgi:hypothetical protein